MINGVLDAGREVDVTLIAYPPVVITFPDTRGSGGTGTITSGEAVYEVRISGAERVVELLEQYSPRRP